MLSFGSLAFAAPWVLSALVVLPVLWWLLKVTPPSPRLVQFPAIRLLRDLTQREETPARMPWWLLLLRLLLAVLVILALAQPVLNPRAVLGGNGPLLLVIDNGWASGRDWPTRQAALDEILAQAERQERPVGLLATARSPVGEAPRFSGLMPAAEARRAVQSLQPQPWPVDRAGLLEAVKAITMQDSRSVHAVWLADGLDDPLLPDIAGHLQRFGSVEVLSTADTGLPHLLLLPSVDGDAFVAPVVRAGPRGEEAITIRAVAEDGRLLARETATFAEGGRKVDVRLLMPTELRNSASRLQIENEGTAAATVLLDERWRRRPVGLVSGRAEGEDQPLLSELYYLERALNPFSEVRHGDVATLLQRELAVLILADVGAVSEDEQAQLAEWVENGGLLIRFAGPRMAQGVEDDLIPLPLRTGNRELGGALSWSTPAHLAPFPGSSPFDGLNIPADVTVSRQVLAEPVADLSERTWAKLEDGTPLVTAAPRGRGWVVLVHTTASPDWSNLSLSGLFVDMLRRMTALSHGVAGQAGDVTLEPLQVLDGQGRLTNPPATVFPLNGREFGPAQIGPRHPPGFYGQEDTRQALNLTTLVTDIAPMGELPPGVMRGTYGERGETELKPALLAVAFVLGILDLVLGLLLRGLGSGLRRRPAMLVIFAILALALPMKAGKAQDLDVDKAIKATSDTYLAYVQTGDPETDQTTRAGLEGLSAILRARTSLEAAGAMPVDLEADELSFFPLLYWSVAPGQPPLSDDARERLNHYLRNGGTLILDTRDQGAIASGEGLRELTQGLDIPALQPLPPEHVLTKAFYLLTDFPGRYLGGDVWVEADEAGQNDGVSQVIIGSNDWVGAWAADDAGRPLYAVVPGGEEQREIAYRVGVNLVMYTLTGNYKSDQVHVPAILERLGQ